MPDDLMRIADAARRVGRHRQSVQRAVRRGHIAGQIEPHTGVELVSLADVRRWCRYPPAPGRKKSATATE